MSDAIFDCAISPFCVTYVVIFSWHFWQFSLFFTYPSKKPRLSVLYIHTLGEVGDVIEVGKGNVWVCMQYYSKEHEILLLFILMILWSYDWNLLSFCDTAVVVVVECRQYFNNMSCWITEYHRLITSRLNEIVNW